MDFMKQEEKQETVNSDMDKELAQLRQKIDDNSTLQNSECFGNSRE